MPRLLEEPLAKLAPRSVRRSYDNSRGNWRKPRTLANEKSAAKDLTQQEHGPFLAFCTHSGFRGMFTSHVMVGAESPDATRWKAANSQGTSSAILRGNAKRLATLTTTVRRLCV